MNFISRLVTTAFILPLSIGGAPAPEAKAWGLAVDGGHNQLVGAIRSTGIQFKLNPIECQQRESLGWYWASQNEMVICQEQATAAGVSGYEVQWTAEDLDTLRHEAQHLVQDCMVGGRRDGNLGSVYRDPIGLAKEVLGGSAIGHILNAYSNLDDHGKVMELEAFSVAALNDPAEQVRDINKFCF